MTALTNQKQAVLLQKKLSANGDVPAHLWTNPRLRVQGPSAVLPAQWVS